jgi:hypothetical protein
MPSLWADCLAKIMTRFGASTSLIVVLMSSLSFSFLGGSGSAWADIVPAPQTCQVGIFVTALRDFSLSEKSFTADFRLWSVCPDAELQPLKSMEFVDALESETAFDTTQKKQNRSESFKTKDQVYWSQRDVSAIFSYNWNVNNYPFDRHVLKIPLEEVVSDTSVFTYTPDFKNSGYQRDMRLGSWEVTGFSIVEEKMAYSTTFGDPTLTVKQGVYSRLSILLPIRRVKAISFFKLTTGVYVAFAVAMLSFFYETGQASLVSARTSLLVGCLFAALVNMRAPESVLGRTEGFTLVDQIHVVAILYIFAAALATVNSRLLNEAGQGKLALLRDRRLLFRLFSISFVVLNVIMISYAAIVG